MNGTSTLRFLLPLLLIPALSTIARAGESQSVWTSVSNRMLDERWAPAACLLADGRHALFAGGYSYAKRLCVDSADIFDERRGRFVHCHGHLRTARDFAVATLLPDSSVLVVGGYHTELGSLDNAERYVPRRNRFEPVESRMSNARELFTATALRDGRVLCAGGLDLHARGTVATADLFDPSTMTFTPVASKLSQDRFGQTAVLLADGRVLIAGGKSWQIGHPDKALASAEIFDPSTNSFHRTKGDMSVARDRPTATLLRDGTVLIAGGQDGASGPLACELFDPSTETFRPLPGGLRTGRMAHGALLLPDGDVAVAGGWSPELKSTTASVEIIDPSTGDSQEGAPMTADALDFGLLEFPDGLLLSAGGKRVDKAPSSLDTGCVTGRLHKPEGESP